MDDAPGLAEVLASLARIEFLLVQIANDRQRPVLSLDDAAAVLSMSPDTFRRYVRPHVRVIRTGRHVLVPVRELERWIERNAERVG